MADEETKSILCPEASRKKNSNRDGQKEWREEDCNTNEGLGNVYCPKAPRGLKA